MAASLLKEDATIRPYKVLAGMLTIAYFCSQFVAVHHKTSTHHVQGPEIQVLEIFMSFYLFARRLIS